MFDKLKKRLTIIYTGIFSLIMVFVVAVTVAIGCISVLRTEKDMLIADIYDEWREWIGSGELPVDPALVKKGEMMSLMYDADGNIIIDQMTDSPYAAALTAIRASWPEPENETELLYFRDKKGTLHFFLAGGCTFWENGQIQARLYTFLNLKDYYDMAVDGARKEDKEAAAARVRQAEGAVSEVQSYLVDASVYSPVTGEVSTIIAEEGELVGSGYPVVAILDMSDMWVTFNIKETLLPGMTIGTRMTGFVPALDRDVEFEVTYIAPQADFATWAATRTQGGFDIRTFAIKARPTAPVENLRPGMSVLVDWDKIAQ